MIGSAFGPTPPGGWVLVAAADFDSNGKPDYLRYNPGTRQTVIWYLNNNVFVSAAFGPTIPRLEVGRAVSVIPYASRSEPPSYCLAVWRSVTVFRFHKKLLGILMALLASALITVTGEQPGSTDKWIAPAAEARKKIPLL